MSATTTMSQNGQITIPATIRRALGLAGGERLAVEQQGDLVVLRRVEQVTERTAGILSAYRREPAPTRDEERAAFEEAVAAEVVASMERE